MAQPPGLVDVYFAGHEVRSILDRAAEDGIEVVWLLRNKEEIFITLPEHRTEVKVFPMTITRLVPGIEVFPNVEPHRPCVEEIPLHNCVLRALSRMSEDAYYSVKLSVQFNLTCEYRILLRKITPCQLME